MNNQNNISDLETQYTKYQNELRKLEASEDFNGTKYRNLMKTVGKMEAINDMIVKYGGARIV